MTGELADPIATIRDDVTAKTHVENPSTVGRAVILAAGRGSRLQALTGDVAKCLVEVGGEPLLERALRALASQGVTGAIVVDMCDVVRERIGSRFAGMAICYVEAPDYATTNNIRSLWNVRDYLDRDVLLLEADIAFDASVIAALLAEPGNSAAVAPYDLALSGTVVRRDRDGRVTSFRSEPTSIPTSTPAAPSRPVNIYVLRQALLRDEVVPRLCRAIHEGQVDRCYESVFRDRVNDPALRIETTLYVEHNILVKDCAAKSMPDADRYMRVAARTPPENREFVRVFKTLLLRGQLSG